MNILDNPILWTDGYKPSHWLQYPEGTTKIYSYWMSRGGKFGYTIPVGLQYYLKTKLSRRITMDDVDEAAAYFEPYFNDAKMFNRAGFERIVKEHGGYWPVVIKFVPEGTPVPTQNVLLTIENTDPELPWVTNYLETLLSLLWYPSTVATISREIKKVIYDSLVRTGTPEAIDYKLHDFGMRGASSIESGAIGGFAHLVNFRGTDTLSALVVAKKIYHSDNVANSIPAAEHSTITAWGREHEYDAYKNMVKQFGNSGSGLYAVVSDSYDIENAVDNIWGKDLKNLVLAQKNLLVVRPDSGVPTEIVPRVLTLLDNNFGSTVNDKGFKVLNGVRVIQGDGVNQNSITEILRITENLGFSTDNLAFGMGGALLQQCDRDTQKFAIKASSAVINGRIVDFRKEPVTDPGKWSRSGKLKLLKTESGYQTVSSSEIGMDVLQTVYYNGVVNSDYSLEDIRENAKLDLDN